MKPILPATLVLLAVAPATAQETRQMEAHTHGVSTLELAAEGGILEINLTSPGADIVGFEYAASTDADKDAVEAAIRTMLLPENIVTLPGAAECRLTEVLAHLHGEDHAHGDDDDMHDDHDDHEDHAADHDHDHGHDDHADAADHDHEDHKADGAVHSEFHARYIFACAHPEELHMIAFPFFDRFENAQKIEAQFVTGTVAGAAEIGRDAAELTLE